MREALAEQLPPDHLAIRRPPLRAVPDAAEAPRVEAARDVEFAPRATARFDAFVGSLAVSGAEGAEFAEEPAAVNFLERLQAAKEGDPEAQNWLTANVGTAIFEGVFKEGYVGETYMDPNADGALTQFGQTNEEIHQNALIRPDRHPVLWDITQAEVFGGHIIEEAFNAGKLKDHYYVVFSLVPKGVPEAQLGADGDGYFLDRLTLNVQASTESEGGRAKTEAAFMPGVEEKENDAFEERLARRHDFQAAAKVYEWLDQEAPDTAAGYIRQGIFIPKSMMPNGIADPMRWLDMAADEVLGRHAERRPEDYAGLRLESKRKEASLHEVRDQVTEELLAATDELETPMEAVDKLWELVREHATKASFTNMNIDPKVFGRPAAKTILKVRHHLQKGETTTATKYMQVAYQEAIIAGCGGGASPLKTGGPAGANTSSNMDHVAGSDEKGAKAFTCSHGHLNIRPHNGTVSACQHKDCDAAVAC